MQQHVLKPLLHIACQGQEELPLRREALAAANALLEDDVAKLEVPPPPRRDINNCPSMCQHCTFTFQIRATPSPQPCLLPPSAAISPTLVTIEWLSHPVTWMVTQRVRCL